MGGIILVIIVVFVSVMIRKVATVALQLTGLETVIKDGLDLHHYGRKV